jgi:hypothetical protein
MTVITPASKTNIYWPQRNEVYFYVRYCILVDGKAEPKVIRFRTYQECLDFIPQAQKEQGFNTQEKNNA